MLTKLMPTRLNGWLDTIFDEEGWPFFSRPVSPGYPAVEIREDQNHYLLTAEVPGMEKKDVSVTVENGVLTISGQKKEEKKEEHKGYHYSERSYGRFERSFRLGDHVSEKDVEASFNNGLLHIQLKKTEKSQPRQIEVK